MNELIEKVITDIDEAIVRMREAQAAGGNARVCALTVLKLEEAQLWALRAAGRA